MYLQVQICKDMHSWVDVYGGGKEVQGKNGKFNKTRAGSMLINQCYVPRTSLEVPEGKITSAC